MINQLQNVYFEDGFAVTPSDTVDIKDDIANMSGVQCVYLHNVAAGATVRVLPAQRVASLGFTLTGTSGTANISINGTNYLATFASTLTVTATNFVNTHKATLAALNITVTSNGVQLRFRGPNPATIAIANATGDLSGNNTAFQPIPVTIYIAQGATSSMAVRRVYNTTPTPPAGLIGYHSGKY